ncbi:hypothetical protein F0562_019600 [Nyssa sinensis]|uniref:Uncharacterized protein n=1 Tax=Nyssa sinensis TaxID=561372 RepID=A0A5J5BPL8_9ASTE|nr:hypothetical protein F0562_019600 [Nyssa sinensis]
MSNEIERSHSVTVDDGNEEDGGEVQPTNIVAPENMVGVEVVESELAQVSVENGSEENNSLLHEKENGKLNQGPELNEPIKFGSHGTNEAKFKDSTVAKTIPEPSSPWQIADPVVYKLVRVEGDGRLVPATEDEVMEVEDLFGDVKSEMYFDADTGQTVGCTSNDGFSFWPPWILRTDWWFQWQWTIKQ